MPAIKPVSWHFLHHPASHLPILQPIHKGWPGALHSLQRLSVLPPVSPCSGALRQRCMSPTDDSNEGLSRTFGRKSRNGMAHLDGEDPDLAQDLVRRKGGAAELAHKGGGVQDDAHRQDVARRQRHARLRGAYNALGRMFMAGRLRGDAHGPGTAQNISTIEGAHMHWAQMSSDCSASHTPGRSCSQMASRRSHTNQRQEM